MAVQEVERLSPGRGDGVGYQLGVKLAITSHREKPILKVEPRRFAILMEGGASVKGRFCAAREPTLPNRYLPRGETATGWVLFDVPAGAKGLLLISELTQPPAKFPLAAPAERGE